MTDIICMSDTHARHRFVDVPDGDILVHAGDFCGRGERLEVSNFLDWMEELPHETKIVVPGNHDICVESDLNVHNEFVKAGVHLLIDEEYIDMKSGLRFYGVPWTPDFYPDIWAFQYRDAGCTPEEIWAKVPEETDILISHGPPYGNSDQISLGYSSHLGSSHLTKRIEELFDSLKGVICGHIHGGYGFRGFEESGWRHSPYIVNAAICTEYYTPVNDPIRWKI